VTSAPYRGNRDTKAARSRTTRGFSQHGDGKSQFVNYLTSRWCAESARFGTVGLAQIVNGLAKRPSAPPIRWRSGLRN